jgi:hypothetical protein
MVKDVELEQMTREQLLKLAKVRGVELPKGRPTKITIIRRLRAEKQARQERGQ